MTIVPRVRTVPEVPTGWCQGAKGARAGATCRQGARQTTAKLAREHNDLNVLTLGARLTPESRAANNGLGREAWGLGSVQLARRFANNALTAGTSLTGIFMTVTVVDLYAASSSASASTSGPARRSRASTDPPRSGPTRSSIRPDRADPP